jgi:hypothetical protein
MYGRELIIYILTNHLEDTLISDGDLVKTMYMDECEAADKFGVGVATIRTWYTTGVLEGIMIGDTVLYYRDQKNPHIN